MPRAMPAASRSRRRSRYGSRPTDALPDALYIHQAVLAYASDFTLLDTALIAHGKLLFDSDIQLASLDHAMWFHRPFRADGWLLYVQDSPSAFGARGYCRGAIFDRRGAPRRLYGTGRPDASTRDRISCSNDGQTPFSAQISCLFISPAASAAVQTAKFRIAFQ